MSETDRAAIDPELYERLLQAARFSAMRILTSTEFHQTWEDVAQEALIEYLHYAEGHEILNPEGLITVIARKRAIPYRNRRERARGGAAFEDDAVEGEVPAWFGRLDRATEEPVSLSVRAGREETLELLRWALPQLSEREQEIVRRYYLNDPTQTGGEIGEALGMNRDAVAKALERTRKRLAGIIGPLDAIDG